MRELSFEDVQKVSGGSDIGDGITLIMAGLTLSTAMGIISATAIGAFMITPLGAAASLALVGAGGFTLGGALPRVTIGPDFGISVNRESDC